MAALITGIVARGIALIGFGSDSCYTIKQPSHCSDGCDLPDYRWACCPSGLPNLLEARKASALLARSGKDRETEHPMLRFTIKTERPQNAGALRTLLEAHDAYERMRATRSYSVHVVVLVSVLVWFGACWPRSSLYKHAPRSSNSGVWPASCSWWWARWNGSGTDDDCAI